MTTQGKVETTAQENFLRRPRLLLDSGYNGLKANTSLKNLTILVVFFYLLKPEYEGGLALWHST